MHWRYHSHSEQRHQMYEAGQIKHPVHTDGLREGFYGFLIVFIAGTIAASFLVPHLGAVYWAWVALCTVAIMVGFGVMRIVRSTAKPHIDMSPEAMRANRDALTRKQIAEAKARGDFDRWDKS